MWLRFGNRAYRYVAFQISVDDIEKKRQISCRTLGMPESDIVGWALPTLFAAMAIQRTVTALRNPNHWNQSTFVHYLNGSNSSSHLIDCNCPESQDSKGLTGHGMMDIIVMCILYALIADWTRSNLRNPKTVPPHSPSGLRKR